MIDIKYKKIYDSFIEKYKEIHVNPWHEIDEEELNNIYNKLASEMDIKNGTSFNYFINYIIKRLSGKDDAHTSYRRFWPVSLNFRIFDNEVLINYPEYLKGSKLISINNIKIDKIINELEEIITYGTIGRRKYEIENALYNKLYLLGLPSLRNNREKLVYEIELLDGSIIKKEFKSSETYKDMFDEEKYLYGEIASYKFIDNCLVYKSTSLQPRYKDKIIEVINKLKKEDLSNADTIIVDIRGNTGGNSSLTKPLIEFLKEHKDKKLICLTDYRVFSAGRYFLVDLINLGAITIGEEISTPINCYGESHHIIIDEDYNFSISEKYFNPLINLEITTKEEFKEKMNKEMLVPVIYKPDILVEETKEDYINGKDTFLEYAINYSNNFESIRTPEELLSYMDNNIEYGFLGKNGKKYYDSNSKDWQEQYYVQSGEELLKTKIGTCFDQVELERLWFEKNNYNFKTIFTWFEVGRKNNYPTHTFLIYEKNGKWYWFEHAWFDMKGIHEFNSQKEAIDYFLQKHFEFVIRNEYDIKIEDKDTLTCYEYTKPNKNLGVYDYLSFVTSNKIEFQNELEV